MLNKCFKSFDGNTDFNTDFKDFENTDFKDFKNTDFKDFNENTGFNNISIMIKKFLDEKKKCKNFLDKKEIEIPLNNIHFDYDNTNYIKI